MNDYPSNVKQKLNSIIADMSEHHWLFSNNPGHNFMRQHQGKLSFYDTMRLIIGMGKGTTNDEIIEDYNKPRLIDYKGYNHISSESTLCSFFHSSHFICSFKESSAGRHNIHLFI